MKNILIVDDDVTILRSLRTLLADRWEIRAAPDAFAAIKAARSQAPDLMIVDLFMPGLDGVGLIRELRSQDVKAPIILISASTNLAVHARALAIRDYLVKPFEIERLEEIIGRLIGEPAA